MQLKKDGEQKLLKLFGHFSVVFLLTASSINAQSFEDFKRSNIQSFKDYRDSRDNTFNKYLKEQWKAYNEYKRTPLYEKPKPKSIISLEPRKIKSVGPRISIKIKKLEPIKLKHKNKIIILDKPKEEGIVKVIKPKIVSKGININFFGSELTFNISNDLKKAKFYPQSQKGIRNFFDIAASSEYKTLLSEIKNVSKLMNLNDWGIYLLVLDISKNLHMNQDNANLFSWFIFNKLGYSVKIGLAKRHIVLLHYSKKMIYSTPNYKFSNKKFYLISNYDKGSVGRLYSYKQDYPQAIKPLDLSLKTLPNLSSNIKKKTISFEEDGKTYDIEFEYNQNIIDFMATYPQADYETYFNSPLDTITYKSIASELKKYVDGKKAGDAMNFVLHFVQKSFKYERDNQQFGREKVMFANETLYFDKSDCEDRAILFSYLIKELFNISVVGVKYKDHMATALYVPMDGDSVKAGQRKLVLADPTYINANIGQSMPKYRSIRPESFVVVKR